MYIPPLGNQLATPQLRDHVPCDQDAGFRFGEGIKIDLFLCHDGPQSAKAGWMLPSIPLNLGFAGSVGDAEIPYRLGMPMNSVSN
jgi:hypothetical protein